MKLSTTYTQLPGDGILFMNSIETAGEGRDSVNNRFISLKVTAINNLVKVAANIKGSAYLYLDTEYSSSVISFNIQCGDRRLKTHPCDIDL